MREFSQRLRLDLPDALARDTVDLTDLFESVVAPLIEAEAELDNVSLTSRERAKDALEHALGRQGFQPLVRAVACVDDAFGGLGTTNRRHRRFQRARMRLSEERLSHLVDRELEEVGNLTLFRSTFETLLQKLSRPCHTAYAFDHVHGNADRSSRFGDRPSDGLPDPPRGVGGEFESTAMIE